MREIKFRGWHTGQKKMFSCEEMAIDQLTLLPDGRFINVSSIDARLSVIYPNDKFIPLQFTGLLDKNGKEIYEGDILDLHSTVNGVNLFEVYYDEPKARFSIRYYTNRMPKRSLEYEYSVSDFLKPCEISGEVDFEVIGNVFQNEDLLNEN